MGHVLRNTCKGVREAELGKEEAELLCCNRSHMELELGRLFRVIPNWDGDLGFCSSLQMGHWMGAVSSEEGRGNFGPGSPLKPRAIPREGWRWKPEIRGNKQLGPEGGIWVACHITHYS